MDSKGTAIKACVLFASVGLLVVALSAVACKDDGLPEDDLAAAALLRLEDFESYWEEEAPRASDSPLTRTCDPRDTSGVTGRARTGTIHNGGIRVTQGIAVFRESPPADRMQRIPGIANCIARGINKGEADDGGFKLSEAVTRRLSFPCKGDQVSAFVLSYKVESEETDFRVYQDIINVNVGRMAMTIFVETTYDEPPLIVFEEWVDIAVSRARVVQGIPEPPGGIEVCRDQPTGV